MLRRTRPPLTMATGTTKPLRVQFSIQVAYVGRTRALKILMLLKNGTYKVNVSHVNAHVTLEIASV
jgi:hypothetical protein